MTHHSKGGFVWYEHMTDDLDKAVAFYSAVVGWQIKDSGMPHMRYMMFGRAGIDVGGMSSWSSMGQVRPAQWIGHIYTPDVAAATNAVVAEGGQQLRPPAEVPHVGSFSVVADPQGAQYQLFQPNQQYAPPRLGPADLGGVGWRELVTTDWPKAWEFYSSHYGWTKDATVDMGSRGLYQTFTLDAGSGGGMMNLTPEMQAAGAVPAWLFYFTIEDIKAGAQRVTDNGGTVLNGPMQVPGGGWILTAADSQGATFALTAGM